MRYSQCHNLFWCLKELPWGDSTWDRPRHAGKVFFCAGLSSHSRKAHIRCSCIYVRRRIHRVRYPRQTNLYHNGQRLQFHKGFQVKMKSLIFLTRKFEQFRQNRCLFFILYSHFGRQYEDYTDTSSESEIEEEICAPVPIYNVLEARDQSDGVYSLPHHQRCVCHMLNLIATKVNRQTLTAAIG